MLRWPACLPDNEYGRRRLEEHVALKVYCWSIDPGLPDETAFAYPPEWNHECGNWPSVSGRQAQTWDQYIPHYIEENGIEWCLEELEAVGVTVTFLPPDPNYPWLCEHPAERTVAA